MMAEKLGRMQPCTTFEKLWGALQAVRADITPANLHYLFESMPRRLAGSLLRSAVPRSGSEHFCPTCKPIQVAVSLLEYTDTHPSNNFHILKCHQSDKDCLSTCSND